MMNVNDSMYPEVYKKMYAHINRVLSETEGKFGTVYMSEEVMEEMADKLMLYSGLKEYYDEVQEDPMASADAVPAVAMNHPMHGGRHYAADMPHRRDFRPQRPGYGRPRHYHNYNTIKDIASILLLGEILGRGIRPNWIVY